ncbi:hypothetical protein BDF21DRAFT_420413 [Thamnidium elegans]|nr:hypothetical protein BDF21DRAFT_420413 [Thamnidium elegans]
MGRWHLDVVVLILLIVMRLTFIYDILFNPTITGGGSLLIMPGGSILWLLFILLG